ncbi:hypothetical protein ACFLU6_08125 [Acidobacteriota bacterium]
MRLGRFLIVFVTISFLASCSVKETEEPVPKFDGQWRTDIKEGGKVTPVELSITTSSGAVKGKFTVLGATGGDVAKGKSFDIANPEITGDKLTFTVPISGKVDEDSIRFTFRYIDDRLIGGGREIREGSKAINVTFSRK